MRGASSRGLDKAGLPQRFKMLRGRRAARRPHVGERADRQFASREKALETARAASDRPAS